MNGPLRQYRGWFGRTARRRCPHAELVGVYGDEINLVGGWRLWCKGCGCYLDGPVSLVEARSAEFQGIMPDDRGTGTKQYDDGTWL